MDNFDWSLFTGWFFAGLFGGLLVMNRVRPAKSEDHAIVWNRWEDGDIITLPNGKDWSTRQVAEFQKQWDAHVATAAKPHVFLGYPVRIIDRPGTMKPQRSKLDWLMEELETTKPPTLYDET